MKEWEKIAIDYNSFFWRNYIWTKSLINQSKITDTPQIYMGIKGYPKKIDYIAKISTWEDAHNNLLKQIEKDISVLENILDETVNNGEKMNLFTSQFLTDDLSKYSTNKVIKSYKLHTKYNIKEYAYGVLVPVLDFRHLHFIEVKLKEILSNKLDKEELEKAYFVFTQPIEDSFALEQEKSILNVYSKLPDKELLTEDASTILEKLENYYPEVYKLLKEHTLKYTWVFYVYSGPAFTEGDFIETMKYYKKKDIDPQNKLNQLEQERKEVFKKREEYFKKLNLNKEERKYVEIVSRAVYLKPRRKDYQSKSYYHLEFLQKEVAKRLNWSLSQVRSALLEEIEDGLNGKEINIDLINERYKKHIIIPIGNEVKIYQGEEVDKFEKEHIKEEEIILENSNIITGQSAFPGIVKGTVKRIDLPDDMIKMKDGDIIVSTATTPSIVPAIRKARAIVADEGGLTCHASIVSREFKIPCVVGTKIGTKILKDGDEVEVDATKGIIKKL